MIKTIFKGFYSVSLFFYLIGGLSAQEKAHYAFPEDWLGEYSGEMFIFFPERDRVDTVGIQLSIEALKGSAKAWSYTMSYQSKKYGNSVKKYRIIQPDSLAKYQYYLDELNGILIEMSYMSNTFFNVFTVGESYLNSRMKREAEGIDFEISSSRKRSSLKTNYAPEDTSEEPFEVLSFPPFTVQRAFLLKVKD